MSASDDPLPHGPGAERHARPTVDPMRGHDEPGSARSGAIDWRGPLRWLVALGLETYEDWRVGRTVRLGAALAYYGLFAIVPVIVVITSLASAIFGSVDVQSAIAGVLGDVLGDLLDQEDREALASAASQELDAVGTQTGLGLLGLGSLLLASSLLFVALQDSFNLIWRVPVRRGLKATALRRLVAFAIVLALGAVLVVVLAVRAVGAALLAFLPDDPVLVGSVVAVVDRLSSLAVLAAVVALLFAVLAPVRLTVRAVVIGAAVTAAFMVAGVELLGLYLDHVATTSITAAASGLLLFLLWLYYVAQILLVGAHLTRRIDLGLRTR